MVQVNSLDILAELVKDSRNSGNLNAGMRDGRTCLHIAAENSRFKVLPNKHEKYKFVKLLAIYYHFQPGGC